MCRSFHTKPSLPFVHNAKMNEKGGGTYRIQSNIVCKKIFTPNQLFLRQSRTWFVHITPGPRTILWNLIVDSNGRINLLNATTNLHAPTIIPHIMRKAATRSIGIRHALSRHWHLYTAVPIWELASSILEGCKDIGHVGTFAPLLASRDGVGGVVEGVVIHFSGHGFQHMYSWSTLLLLVLGCCF